MRLAGKYSKFKPMAGFETLLASEAIGPGMGLIPEQGIPLEALEGTSSPEALRQGGIEQVPPSAFGGPGPVLGGPIGGPIQTGGMQPAYTTDIPIKAEYRNIYGTNVNATYNPTTGSLQGGATIPIGAAEKGFRLGVEGSYQPGVMDFEGVTPPPGYSGMIRFSKNNRIDPRTYEAPGAEKYSFGVGLEGTPRRVPPRRTVPVQLFPPGF